MAASMWRMNGLCRSMTGVLLLCALLFGSEVMCQDNSSAQPTTDDSITEANSPTAVLILTTQADSDSILNNGNSGDSAISTIATSADVTTSRSNDQDIDNPENPHAPSVDVFTTNVPPVVPEVECVGEGQIPEKSAVKVEVTGTKDCETTKRIIRETPIQWCSSEKCNLKIFQDDSNVLMTSSDVKLSSLAGALQSETLKDKLGLKKVDVPSSSNSSVFVGTLVTGLLAALGMTVGYFKCQRRPDTKGAKLAEEAYPVDQENQGNTLASEAPLNPPPETQEKPSVNGESLEAVKTETSPPTNGHSTAKTADTEL
ncbi:uncharacterized protein cd34 [Anableps anableps]